MAPKSKNSDAGTSTMPKRSYKSASYQWRGESSRLKKERKESCPEIAKIYGKNEASVKLWKRKKKKFKLVLLTHLKLQSDTCGVWQVPS